MHIRHTWRPILSSARGIRSRSFSTCTKLYKNDTGAPSNLSSIRNIGIIAHIDAGKTTTTERMLFYSGFTRQIGDVDDGSTVTDFLPAERARGITIQSAAITFHWPPKGEEAEVKSLLSDQTPHTVNLIDTPGHADFTFEVIRSLRILDGAVCILDGVAGVEAQTEKVWQQASNHRIPRIIYINKLDRDGAAFNRTVKEIASRLHTWPLLCHIPLWHQGKFVGIGDAVNFRVLQWPPTGDGSRFSVVEPSDIIKFDPDFHAELLAARKALIEGLTEQDDILVEEFLDSDEDWEGFSGEKLTQSLRRVLLKSNQVMTPVFAGASFRNIGVQPLLDAVSSLLPSPPEAPDPDVSFGETKSTLGALLSGSLDKSLAQTSTRSSKKAGKDISTLSKGLEACALAFKVVNDPKRGVLVYVRVYSGTLSRNSLLYNTSLAVTERAPRLLRMYANDAVEVQSLEKGHIGVIAGLKHARTGDTLVVYSGAGRKGDPPVPINQLQLRPIDVPPPLFFTSVEPNSLSEERNMKETLNILLREDPSLSVRIDEESGQTQLAGMGELHLEIARDRLINDLKVKATTGKIEIGYRETPSATSGVLTETFDREVAGVKAKATIVAEIKPFEDNVPLDLSDSHQHASVLKLTDANVLTVNHPTIDADGNPASPEDAPLPSDLPMKTIMEALKSGALAALARGPGFQLPVHSTCITINLDPSQSLDSTTTPAALTSATRQAVAAALASSASKQPNSMMEPVMLVTISVNEAHMGAVIHDLSSSRGGSVLSLDADDEDAADAAEEALSRRLTPAQLERVYAPPDPFAGSSSGGGSALDAIDQQRQIRARVPLKEMVGYLKHLRSLTGGRGTFVMSVDRFEKMTSARTRAVLAEMRGDYV